MIRYFETGNQWKNGIDDGGSVHQSCDRNKKPTAKKNVPVSR